MARNLDDAGGQRIWRLATEWRNRRKFAAIVPILVINRFASDS